MRSAHGRFATKLRGSWPTPGLCSRRGRSRWGYFKQRTPRGGSSRIAQALAKINHRPNRRHTFTETGETTSDGLQTLRLRHDVANFFGSHSLSPRNHEFGHLRDHVRISVVVPLFNKYHTIERTINSVLLQEYSNLEVIIVDDGSTDGSADLIETRYADAKITIVRQRNSGPGAARNLGLKLSSGELVTFLDADDEWSPQLLSRAVSYLEKHPDCAAFTSAFYRDPEGVDRWAELAPHNFIEGPWALDPQIQRGELSTCLAAFHSCTAVYRRTAIEALGGFYADDRCTFGEDVFLWIKIVLNHPIYRHLEPLGRYHTEDSELGVSGRKGSLPLEPVFTQPEQLRAVCPPPLAPVLELWLGGHAIHAAFAQLDREQPEGARWLLATFKRTKSWPLDYAKIMLRLAWPKTWQRVRRLRARLMP